METIIIYTKYYLQAVVEILDTYELDVQVQCFPTYGLVADRIKTTPNLRGVIFLEHRTGFGSSKAYKAILTTLDEIAESSKQPICVSIIANTDAPRKIISGIETKYLSIYHTKFGMMHTDLLRFKGLATVIANTIGVENNSILLELDKDNMDEIRRTNLNKLELIQSCLEVVSVPNSRLKDYEILANKLEPISDLLTLRQSSDSDEQILARANNLTRLFAKHAIERREGQDE